MQFGNQSLISRTFCKKRVSANFSTFLTYTQCGKNIVSLISWNDFRVKLFTKSYFHGNLLTEKIFRQINSLAISLVKTLLSRKFANLRNFHTDHMNFYYDFRKKISWNWFVSLDFTEILCSFFKNVDFKSYHTLAIPDHSFMIKKWRELLDFSK